MKEPYVNDRKAPRMKKGEFSKIVVTNELFKKFKKEFPEYHEMTWAQFTEYWADITKEIRREAIYNPLGVKLGSALGELKLQYLPYNFHAIDYPASQAAGYKIKNLAITQKGKIPKIKWERRAAVKMNKMLQFYAFNYAREMASLAAEYMQGHSDQVRIARNTLGGISIWRQKMNKK